MVDNLQQEVLAVLEERFGVRKEDVTLQSRLREDLDLDSIDLFDIMGMLEEKTGVSIDVADFLKAKTLGDFLSILQEIVQRTQAA